jgi:23S rRNA pseudouridine2605 synthase
VAPSSAVAAAAFVSPPSSLLVFGGTGSRTLSTQTQEEFDDDETIPNPKRRRTYVSVHAAARRSKKPKEFFRADRVLAQRTDSPRSVCFDLLKQKRVWTKEENNDTVDDTMTGKEKDSTTTTTSEETPADEDNQFTSSWTPIPGPASKISLWTPLWIDKAHPVPLPPPMAQVYHKPKWVLSVTSDPKYNRPCLNDLPKGLHPVGRLDYDSSGLLLLSSSGALTQRLLHPKHAVPKIYEVVVTGAVDPTLLTTQLTEGVETTDGIHTAEVLEVSQFDADHVAAYLADIRANLPSHYNQTDLEERGYLNVLTATPLSTVTLRVTEGKYRMVRRILANCGHPVVSLQRQQIGIISLDDLPVGATRDITPEEKTWLKSLMNQE